MLKIPNPLYLFGGQTDNSFVQQMVEIGIKIAANEEEFPRLRIDEKNREIYFEESPKDFSVGKFELFSKWQYLKKSNQGKNKEPLAKAIGLKNFNTSKTILDMSCGTGKDALLLLSFGGNVIAYERNEIIYILLCYYRVVLNEVENFPAKNFRLYFGEAKFNQNLEDLDVIYFDPMYGDSANKKAAPRKQMQQFRDFVGEDTDFLGHLDWAIQTAKNRVVLKKSLKSSIDLPQFFSHSIVGKSTRYDVYLTKN